MHRMIFFLLFPLFVFAEIKAGVAKSDLTPPIGTPSAGYSTRRGAGMQGVHDPLYAIALALESEGKSIVLCSVDHLGFTYWMSQEIIRRVRKEGLDLCAILIGSSHTHSGGGAYLHIPGLGYSLAGRFDPAILEFYIRQTSRAIIEAWKNRMPAKIGIGYGNANGLSRYRSSWPRDLAPLSDVAMIKVEKMDGTPLSVLFNFPLHPTVLESNNMLFSSDFVGYAREHLRALLGSDIEPLYFNGAQGDIIPVRSNETDPFKACESLGCALAQAVADIWKATPASEDFSFDVRKEPYAFKPQPTPKGLDLSLAIASYQSEINLLVLNKTHAFITIPGELSCAYDLELKEEGTKIGYDRISILGLTNDTHGYIILPESWKNQTFESYYSFGGRWYGEETKRRALALLKALAP